MGFTSHGLLVFRVKEYVAQGYPNNDVPGQSPHRSLGHMIEVGGTPEDPKTPPDGPTSGEPEWVCHNVAKYMAALMRELGYPVREVNMYLSQKNRYNYQSAAIQVWFEGKWHFADPFTCTFDPEAAAEMFNKHTDLRTVYWDGTVPVEDKDWIPYRQNPPPAPWKIFPEGEVGNDLQKRIYPKLIGSRGNLTIPEERFQKYFGGGAQYRIYAQSSRASAEKSGVAITCKTPGVSLYLKDARDRITDAEVQQIPGSFHITEGTEISSDTGGPIRLESGEMPTEVERHEEWVFFGTEKFIAEYDEIGEHELFLYVLSSEHKRAELTTLALGDVYPVSYEGIPEEVDLVDGIAVVPFTVNIDPASPEFHVLFDLLMDNGVLDKGSYWPASDTLQLLLQRRDAFFEEKTEDVQS